jgi:drug/metabolite transporter (DMT)-like permease
MIAGVLLGFASLTSYVLATIGFVGFFQAMQANAATVLAMLDLTIVLSLAAIWMWQDSRERNLPFWPYALLAVGLGAAGPLAYLLHRSLREGRTAPVAA